MRRFWNLKTKLIALLVLVLLGSFAVQKYVHSLNEKRLLNEVVEASDDLAKEVSGRLEERQMQLTEIETTSEPAERGTSTRWVWEQRAKVERVVRDGKPQLKITKTAPRLVPVTVRSSAASSVARRPTGSDLERRSRTQVDRAQFDRSQTDLGASLLEIGELPTTPRQSFQLTPRPIGTKPVPTARPLNSSTSSSATGATEQGAPTEPPSPISTDTSQVAEIPLSPYAERFRCLFEEYRHHDLLATVGVFLMGIGLAWILGMRMVRPMYKVMEGLRGVARGNLDVSVPEGGSSEFALLGEQFNRMVGRLRENRQIERELEQRERIQLMGDLAAGVAHDVRNPLNAIHLNIDQIREEFRPEDPAARDRFLRFTSDIQREVVRLNQLVTNFLSLARPMTEERKPVDANELLLDLHRLLQKEASGRSVEIELALAETLPRILWGRQEVMSALLNLTMNAFQAMEPAGGRLTLASEVRGVAGAREVVISIRDTGHGIPEDQLDKVFIPYFTTRQGGTGLGMAIARRVIERNGGRIELESRVGIGTSISCIFPAIGVAEVAA